ncbi:MAG TPA: GH92 family glycosyl hydrolase [Candidatus Xenobia bacterium]|jgi:predicted alpha-1,2-mannosidase
MKLVSLLIACLLLMLAPPASCKPLADEVDPFLGSAGDGNCLVGAGVPFGLVWVSPDTNQPMTSGYNIDEEILGLSQTHEAGTGGLSKYGNFLVTPESGAVHVTDLASRKSDEVAHPGYYAVTLMRPQVRAEVTATRRVGFHRYTFERTEPIHLLIDASSCITLTEEAPMAQLCLDSAVHVVPPNRIEGYGHFYGGWNPHPYRVFFSAVVDAPFKSFGTWTRRTMHPGAATAKGNQIGAWLTFSGQRVLLKIGVSFISIEQARANIAHELPGWDFDAVRHHAEEAWETCLSTIGITGGSATDRQMFYSMFYHCFQMPHDFTGENPWWKSSEPHYEDFYCIWDTFRTLNPLLTLIAPQRERDIVRSLLDTFVHTGWLPDARIAGSNGRVQGGTNGDVVVADAVVKKLGGFSLETAFRAVQKDADVQSPDPMWEGRDLYDYLRVGYMSLASRRSASRTLEYAYDDFCAAEVAQAVGRRADAARYLARSRNWRNLWDPEYQVVRPRHLDGSFLTPYGRNWGSGSWRGAFYEGTAWQYSTFIPHDMKTVIRSVGGDQAYVDWLDAFFNSGSYTHDNEPDMLALWLYIHAGRPDRTADGVRHILQTAYHLKPDGLPGNDDSGTISAWYVWASIGLYPNAGQDWYYIGSPIFSSASLKLEGGKTFRILADKTSPDNRYVQSATLNGEPLDRAWLRQDEIQAGGYLVLEMGPQPSPWGRVDRPPSPATEP